MCLSIKLGGDPRLLNYEGNSRVTVYKLVIEINGVLYSLFQGTELKAYCDYGSNFVFRADGSGDVPIYQLYEAMDGVLSAGFIHAYTSRECAEAYFNRLKENISMALCLYNIKSISEANVLLLKGYMDKPYLGAYKDACATTFIAEQVLLSSNGYEYELVEG